MISAGYSGTPLPKKLGIGENSRVLLVKAPTDVGVTIGDLPAGVAMGTRLRTADVVLVFATTVREMSDGVARAMRVIPRDGTIWLCWPKKASGIDSALQKRETVMDHMLPLGLVDVKVAAISDVWSGLKFVIRKELR